MLLTSEGTNKTSTFPTCNLVFQLLNAFNQNIFKEQFSSIVQQKQIPNFYPVHKARIALLQLALVMPKGNLNKAVLKKE